MDVSCTLNLSQVIIGLLPRLKAEMFLLDDLIQTMIGI